MQNQLFRAVFIRLYMAMPCLWDSVLKIITSPDNWIQSKAGSEDKWLQIRTPNGELEAINTKLLIAKRVIPRFWRLKEDVRKYFLDHAQNPEERRTLQTIELLCNARDVVQELSLENMRTMANLLNDIQRVPEYIRHDVMDYFDNEGTRSWSTADRRVMPEAWNAVKA